MNKQKRAILSSQQIKLFVSCQANDLQRCVGLIPKDNFDKSFQMILFPPGPRTWTSGTGRTNFIRLMTARAAARTPPSLSITSHPSRCMSWTFCSIESKSTRSISSSCNQYQKFNPQTKDVSFCNGLILCSYVLNTPDYNPGTKTNHLIYKTS